MSGHARGGILVRNRGGMLVRNFPARGGMLVRINQLKGSLGRGNQHRNRISFAYTYPGCLMGGFLEILGIPLRGLRSALLAR